MAQFQEIHTHFFQPCNPVLHPALPYSSLVMQDAQVRSPRGSLGDCIVHRVRRATGVLLQIQVRRF